MHELYVHGSVSGVPQHLAIGPRETIGSLNGLVVPVRPVHPLLKDRDSKGMGDSLQYSVTILSIQISISGGRKTRG